MDVSKAVLTEKQRKVGLTLDEPDFHTAVLKDKDGKVVASWAVSENGPSIDEIMAEAETYIATTGA